MSSKEFWEDEPQLYWAYRFSFEKRMEYEQKKEIEQLKYSAWLNGISGELAVTVALNNCFAKKKMPFPTYQEFYKKPDEIDNQIKRDLEEQLEGVEDREERGAIEFNYWARL